MSIRKAVKDDIDDVMALDYENKECWGNRDTESGTIDYFQAVLNNRHFKFIVQYDNGLLVGFTIFHLNDDTNNITIHYLVVREGYRKAGHGRYFLKMAENLSPSEIKLGIPEENLDAQLFLRACGYKCVKIRKNYYLDEKGNKTRNMYSFAKKIGVKEVV